MSSTGLLYVYVIEKPLAKSCVLCIQLYIIPQDPVIALHSSKLKKNEKPWKWTQSKSCTCKVIFKIYIIYNKHNVKNTLYIKTTKSKISGHTHWT